MKKPQSKSQKQIVSRPNKNNLTKISKLPPRNLTPSLCKQVQQDLIKACKSVVEKHGLTIEGGDLSNLELRHSFNIEFRVGIPTADGSIFSTEKAMFEVLAEDFGLKPSDYGREFKIKDELFRVTGINPNRPKYPISAKRVIDDQGFKFSSDVIGMYLANRK